MMAAHFRSLAEPAREEVFRRIGLPPDKADQVGLALVRPAGDGLFEFDDDGDVSALIIPAVYGDELDDLVAVDANDSRRVWSLTGSTELLGEGNLASLFGCRLRIHRSPLEWLRADGDGVAVVRWTAGVAAMLHAAPGIILNKQHRKYAEHIERRIAEHVRPAEIFIDKGLQ